MTSPDNSFSIVIKADLAETRGAAERIMSNSCIQDFDDAQRTAIDLALNEAINNAIEHACQGDPSQQVQINCTTIADGVRFDVLDQGTALSAERFAAIPDEIPEPDPDDPDSWMERGRGLILIKSTMDSIDYHSEGGENRFSFSKRYTK